MLKVATNETTTVNKEFKPYPSTYCLMQSRCFICNNFKKKSSKLESQPLMSILVNGPHFLKQIKGKVKIDANGKLRCF